MARICSNWARGADETCSCTGSAVRTSGKGGGGSLPGHANRLARPRLRQPVRFKIISVTPKGGAAWILHNSPHVEWLTVKTRWHGVPAPLCWPSRNGENCDRYGIKGIDREKPGDWSQTDLQTECSRPHWVTEKG